MATFRLASRFTSRIQPTLRGYETFNYRNISRYFSSSHEGGGNNNNNNKDDDNVDDDPFGLKFEDGKDLGKLGPTNPPKYRRDSVTGKFTGEEETELSPSERRLLNMDTLQEQDYLVNKVLKEWNVDVDEEEDGEPKQLSRFAQRIREDNMAMNTIGRSVESQAFRGKLEDGEDAYEDPSKLSKPLSPSEFQVFKKIMKEEYDVDIDEDDVPVEPTNERTKNDYDGRSILSAGTYADNDELNAQWLSSTAVRFMDETKDDDPFSDLLPSDLTPAKLVNRRKAKKIPRQLLHHNNLALLRRYITPAGQIMNRVQSRLGAKDQRKVAKLIKRARAMGLIPTSGQFLVEAHGNIHEHDIREDREWEQELVRRGLVVEKKKKNKSSTSPRASPLDQEF